MYEDAQVTVEAHIRYSSVKNKIKVFLTPTNKLDELKAQLNRYFIHIGENQRTSHVVVYVPCVDLGEDKEDDFWKTVYFPQLIEDDRDVMITCLGKWLKITFYVFMSDPLKCNIY